MVTPLDWASDALAPSRQKIWDLVVMGGGTAGIVAAKTAADLGAEVLLIERERTGGDCLWTGCVPSKALLSMAHAAATARESRGIEVRQVDIDFGAVMRHVHDAIATIEPIDSPATLRESGVRVAHGDAAFTGPSTIEVDGQSAHFNHALVAVGSSPAMPPITGLAEASPLTSDTVWSLEKLPASVLVLGGGNIGCELGQALARLGSQVTIVEAAERILPNEDGDAATLVAAALTADGVTVRVGAAVTSVDFDGEVVVHLGDGSTATAERILVAVGRRPRHADLGLEAAGVDLDDRGFVRVSSSLRTSNRRIYAAGDITGHPQFTHVAGTHGSVAASNAVLGLRRKAEVTTIPRVTYTHPEIAAFGPSLAQAEETGLTTHTVRHDEVDRAVAEGQVAGYSRLVLDRKGRVVGASIVGPRAGESLAEVTLAARHGLRARDLASSMHAYPTYGDGVWKASLEQVRIDLSGGTIRRVMAALLTLRRRWSRR